MVENVIKNNNREEIGNVIFLSPEIWECVIKMHGISEFSRMLGMYKFASLLI